MSGTFELVGRVGRAMVIGMRAGEKMQHGQLLGVERRMIARAESARLE